MRILGIDFSVRHLHVSRELQPMFEGWLEFAGHDVPGVAQCRAWPREFTIEEGICGCANCSGGRTVVYCVSAKEWPPSCFVDGEWSPFWTGGDPMLLNLGTWRWL
jgi:hypothetical protein